MRRWLDGITDSMDMSLSKFQGNGEGQGSHVCWSPRGHKELDMTQQLNNNNTANSLCCTAETNSKATIFQ